MSTNQKETVQITSIELYDMLANLSGAKMATIETMTVPSMRKTRNPFYDKVLKMTRVNVTLNFIYANSVNNQRSKEGNEEVFVPHQRKWGVRISNSTLVTHDGKLYVEAKMNGKPQSVEYYLTNGESISKDVLLPFLPKKSSNQEHQGVEKEIVLRDYSLDSITAIDVNGKRFEIVN